MSIITLNRFVLILLILCSSTLVWGKPCSSPRKAVKPKPQSRGGYPGYLAVEGPEPIFEELPAVDFNRLMLTPIPAGVVNTPSLEHTERDKPENQERKHRKAVEHREDRVIRVESTAGGEYYAPHHRVDIESREEEPDVFPEDLLFFYDHGGKGAHGDKNYYIPFNVSPGDLIPQNQAVPSRATYRRER